MTDNRQIQSSDTSNSFNEPVDRVEEGISRMKIENANGDYCEDKDGTDSSPPYPDRPGETDCIYYLRTGLCGYGSRCRFNHPVRPAKSVVQGKGELPQRDGQPDCGFYLKTGTCKYGLLCKFHHPSDKGVAGQVPLNTMGLPIRQDSKSCPYYMQTYTCKFGAACKFNHPQPQASPETVWHLPGASAIGTVGTSVFPSIGMPYASGISAWLLPRPPYLSGPRVSGLQTYGSIPIPSSQGIMPAQPGWNSYMGTVPPNIYGTNFYNAKDPEGLGTAYFPSSSVKNLCLPERPDQAECRHYMSTGSCKYGSDCRYYHPKERVAQLAIHTVGSHGLPLRPGEAICSYFNTYGVCKYGPSCRFDHPIAGYVSSYSFSFPPLPASIHGQPYSSYHDNSSINNYSESSPSKSSRISDWIQKPQPWQKDNRYPDAKSSRDLKEPVDSRPHIPTTTKVIQDK